MKQADEIEYQVQIFLEEMNSKKDMVEREAYCNEFLTPDMAKKIESVLGYLLEVKILANTEPRLLVMLFTKAFFNANFENTLQRLIWHYKFEPILQQASIITLFHLLQSESFREQLKNDEEISYLFMQNFWDDLGIYIEREEASLSPELAKEFMAICQVMKKRELNQSFIDSVIAQEYGFLETLSNQEKYLMAIAKFLADPVQVFKQLEWLEGELAKRAAAVGIYNQETYLLEGHREGPHYRDKKLLTNFLREFSEQNGFTGDEKVGDELTADSFFSMLRRGGLFKDTAFKGDFHGDLTHYIQWVLIMHWYQEDPSRLNCLPAELYKWMGQVKEGAEGEMQKTKNWNLSFEDGSRFYQPSRLDFRNVIHTNKFLLSPGCPFPILHQLIARRSVKKNKDPGPSVVGPSV